MNGTNSMVVVHPDRTIKIWGRQKELVKNYQLPAPLRDEILSFTPAGTFSIYNAELLHTKITATKHILYFFDTLVYDGQHLIGISYEKRHQIIYEKLKGRHIPLGNIQNNQLYVAHNIPSTDWDHAWQVAQSFEACEGLIIKDKEARLALPLRPINNSSFMCRVRKATKNFQH